MGSVKKRKNERIRKGREKLKKNNEKKKVC